MTRSVRTLIAILSASSLAACASTYTGPVEVNRFVAEDDAGLGQGSITVSIDEDIANQRIREAFAAAVTKELRALGYEVIVSASTGDAIEAGQIAEIRTSRDQIETVSRRSPVSVGVGGSTGSYGSGLGLGIGINLGGGERGPTIITNLSVRISTTSGETLWEGRAELPTSIKSPYSEVDLSANTLAAALFRDFPGGNGETVRINVKELEESE